MTLDRETVLYILQRYAGSGDIRNHDLHLVTEDIVIASLVAAPLDQTYLEATAPSGQAPLEGVKAQAEHVALGIACGRDVKDATLNLIEMIRSALLPASAEPLAHIVERLDGSKRQVMLIEKYDPRKPEFWVNEEARAHHRVTPLYASPSSPVDAGAVEAGQARALEEWHEDFGFAVWWTFKDGDWLGEPSYIGSPLCDDWPGYHTHWTPHPKFPAAPTEGR